MLSLPVLLAGMMWHRLLGLVRGCFALAGRCSLWGARSKASHQFVVLKGPARCTRMTPAGLRSVFRYHRRTTGIQLANPHHRIFGKEGRDSAHLDSLESGA
jgi:hypothetical protein